MDEIVTVYVALEDEGTEVWLPVRARHLGSDSYLIQSPAPEGAVYDPDYEGWEFKPGTAVRCEKQTFSDGSSGLVAKTKELTRGGSHRNRVAASIR